MKIGDMFVQVRATGLNMVSRQVAGLGGAFGKLGGIWAIAAQSIIKWAKRMAIVFVAVSVAATAMAAKFEFQMAKVATMFSEQEKDIIPQYENAVRSMSVEFGQSLATMTSVDLMTAVTSSPALRAICWADSKLMSETISILPAPMTTSAITLPNLTSFTLPLI